MPDRETPPRPVRLTPPGSVLGRIEEWVIRFEAQLKPWVFLLKFVGMIVTFLVILIAVPEDPKYSAFTSWGVPALLLFGLLAILVRLWLKKSFASGMMLVMLTFLLVRFTGDVDLQGDPSNSDGVSQATEVPILSYSSHPTPTPASHARLRGDFCTSASRFLGGCVRVEPGNNLMEVIPRYARARGISGRELECIDSDVGKIALDVAARNGLPSPARITAGDYLVLGEIRCPRFGVGGPVDANHDGLIDGVESAMVDPEAPEAVRLFAYHVDDLRIWVNKRETTELTAAINKVSANAETKDMLYDLADVFLTTSPRQGLTNQLRFSATSPAANEVTGAIWLDQRFGTECTTVSAIVRARLGTRGTFESVEFEKNAVRRGACGPQ